MKPASLLAAACLLPLALSGCKPSAAVRQGEPVGAGTTYEMSNKPKPNPALLGVINGTVTITGKLPAPIAIDMSQDPACAITGGKNMTEQIVGKAGRVANVFVYIQSSPFASGTAPGTATMDQKGCRFVPHVVAIQQGGTVEFRNSDPTMHNVHTMPVQVGNRSTDVSEGPGAKPENLTFTSAENMIPVRCNNHPWMQGFVNVSPTPYFAVSGQDGTFRIPDVPAGTYTLVFVHEKLGTQQMQVTVTAHGDAQANAIFPIP